MTDKPNQRFDQLLKAMVHGETPKTSDAKSEREPDQRTLRHKKPNDDQSS